MTSRPNGIVIGVSFLGVLVLLSSDDGQALSAMTGHIRTDVSVQVLPETGGAMCPLPNRAALNAVAAIPQQGPVAVGPGAARTRPAAINRRPLRLIKDPNPAWSSVSVNAEHDMVVLTDENLFRVVEYSRSDNTAPTGPVTEPRRVIGGDKTHMEMICGSYIDPKTLEVYVTNNDSEDWMPVFSREARGNVAPDRLLSTPHRAWGIAADEIRQELFMTIQDPSAVAVYRKTAANNDAPLRLLEGDATELADPRGIALDMKNELLVVANHGHRLFYGGPAVSTMTGSWEEWIARPTGLNVLPRVRLPGLGTFEMPSINIYARGANGNTPPLRIIKGPKTQLNWPSHVAVHEERGEIFVANDADDSVLVFRETDRGDVAPIRVIKGPRTKVKNPTGLTLDVKNGELWVASMGNYTAAVFPITATGNAAPLRQIRGGPPNQMALMIGNPGAVAYDSKREELLVPNWVAHPQLAAFARLANGAEPPARRIYGQNSKLSRTMHDIRYNPVDDEIVVPNPFSNAILTFRGGADSQEAPVRIIQGPNTQLTGPQWLDVDTVNREIFVPGPGSVQVYPLNGNGDARPKRTIQGPDTQLLDGDSIAVDPLNNLLVVAGRNDKVILVFDRAASGNAKPLRVIAGPNTDIDRLNQLAVYPEGRLVVAALPSRGIAVWSLDDDGDVAPKWAINGDQTSFKKVRGVALNAKQKEIYVTDTGLNGVLTFSVPEIFESPASGVARLNRR